MKKMFMGIRQFPKILMFAKNNIKRIFFLRLLKYMSGYSLKSFRKFCLKTACFFKQSKFRRKSISGVFVILVCCSHSVVYTDDQEILSKRSKKHRINIISNKNGVGLSRDIALLERELGQLGHDVNFIDYRSRTPPASKADINLFVQAANEYFFPFARLNYLIPNPECCNQMSEDLVYHFDLILCRTHEVQRIYQNLNPNTVYMSFTCDDRYSEGVQKNFNSVVHLAGASVQKGTARTLQMWIEHPELPTLTLLKHFKNIAIPKLDNLNYISEYLPDETLKRIQNSCGIHLCPSEAEGFGHYIMEALSCGAVVVTTDAPPMNEFISDKRCLIPYNKTEIQNLATLYFIDVNRGAEILKNILNLPKVELDAISRRNRRFYLENDRFFKQRLAAIFNDEFPLNPKMNSNEIIFTKIYREKSWGPHDGEGSLPENTKLYRQFLKDFMSENQIRSVVDIGCGNWLSSKLIDWSTINYTGYDIVKSVIEDNNKKYSTPTIKFIHGDATQLDLPSADLLICKDVFSHLPNKDIVSILSQMPKFKNCLFVDDVDPTSLNATNSDLPCGKHRYIDLKAPPFMLKCQPLLVYTAKDATKMVVHVKK